jgi:hypothetical protein
MLEYKGHLITVAGLVGPGGPTMKGITVSAVVVLLILPVAALGLGFESFGNAPVGNQAGWAEGAVDVVNLKSRVYSLWGGAGNLNFYYQGDARDLNEAIRKFAAIKAPERRLVLFPGRGKAYSSERKVIDFDWRLHAPAGRYQAATKNKHAVLTACINTERPRGTLDRKKAVKWITDLDDDSFETRESASRELEKLRALAKPLLRETLKGRPSPEVRRRINTLLARLRGFDVDDLEIPAGVTVVTAGELLDGYLKDLSDIDETKCVEAMWGLVELAPCSNKVVPALTGMFAKDKSAYIRSVAAVYLGNICGPAKSALPALKAGLSDADQNVRSACQRATKQIEEARPEPRWGEEVQRRGAILKDLVEWKKGSGK